MGSVQSNTHSSNMQIIAILSAVVASAVAFPQLVPYVHQEVAAEPYVHIEPALNDDVLGLTPEAQGVIAGRAAAAAAPINYNYNAAPAINYNNQAGRCVNNRGEGVPCRTQF